VVLWNTLRAQVQNQYIKNICLLIFFVEIFILIKSFENFIMWFLKIFKVLSHYVLSIIKYVFIN